MSQWAEIRHLHLVEKVPKKEIARRLKLNVKTVRDAVDRPTPPVRVSPARASGLDPWREQIMQWLREDRRTTAKRIRRLLLPLAGPMSPRTVRRYVAALRAAVTSKSKEAFVHRSVLPGTTYVDPRVMLSLEGEADQERLLPASWARCTPHNPYRESSQSRMSFGELTRLGPDPDWGADALQGVALHREVAPDVDLRGLHVGVTQEVLDGDERDVRLEEMHCFGVAERVRSDAGPSETRERSLGALHVLLQEVACAVTGEALPVPVLDQRRGVIFGAPCRSEEASHQPSGLRQQGRESFAPALAEEPDKRWWGESNVARSHIQEFLDARPGVVEEGHEEVVAFPRPASSDRSARLRARVGYR